MDYLGKSLPELDNAGGSSTAREITQQPALWADVERLIEHESAALRAFLKPVLAQPNLRIVLTGAGTSAFIGECLAPALLRAGHSAVAVATTDLVGAPHCWLTQDPLLLVSFARSGNSPESVAALDLAEQAVPTSHHLIVTCNGDGALYQRARGVRMHPMLLPESSNDRGFAMTSSFTGMLLAAASAFGLLAGTRAAALSAWGRQALAALPLAATLANAGFERIVYLGSNECKGLAREAALKTLELSDGRVAALGETPLGFRHGPKTIVNDRTLVVMFLGNDPYTRRYDIDVLNELRVDGIAARVVALSSATDANADAVWTDASPAPDLALCFPYIVFAQMLAFLQSIALGLRPDVPNALGVVNRVVQPFAIHPWSPSR